MTAADFVTRLESVRQTPNGWQARCPAHEDRQASLSVAQGTGGKIVVHCHAGCRTEDVLGKLGLKLADLFEQRNEDPARGHLAKRIVATYPYHDEAGNLLFEVVRFDPKDFRQRRPDSSAPGGWSWSVKGVRRVAFRLPQVLKAVADGRPVWIAEGEKDVLALDAAGFPGTCNAGGAGKWLPDHSQHFAFSDVVVVADKDEPGRKHAQQVAASMFAVGASVRVIEVPDVNGHACKDAADYFAAGGQAAELDELAQAAPIWASSQQSTGPDVAVESEAAVAGDVKAAPRYIARPIGSIVLAEAEDPTELLRHHFLCRGGGLLLAAPTGVGKSTLAIQCALLWAVGRDCLGLDPARPLRSLYVQAENDDGDLAELRNGILDGCQFTADERRAACDGVHVVTINDLCGPEFILRGLAPLLEPGQFDVCFTDPLLSYIGGDISRQEVVSPFLRNHLNPVIHRAGVGAVLVHHTNKPPSGREKPDWQAGDFAYSGSGSADLANWARAVVAIRSLGSHDVFELRLGKRGRRAGWKDAEGNPSYARAIAHGRDGIYWREAEPAEQPAKPGRPGGAGFDDVVALLNGKELTAGDWQKLAETELGVSRRTFFRLKNQAAKAGAVFRSVLSEKWGVKP